MPLHFVFTSGIEPPTRKKAKTKGGKDEQTSPVERMREMWEEQDEEVQDWLLSHFGDGEKIESGSQMLKYVEVLASHTHIILSAQRALSVSVVQEYLPHDEKSVIVHIHAFEVAEEGKAPESGTPVSISTFVSPPGLNQGQRTSLCLESASTSHVRTCTESPVLIVSVQYKLMLSSPIIFTCTLAARDYFHM